MQFSPKLLSPNLLLTDYSKNNDNESANNSKIRQIKKNHLSSIINKTNIGDKNKIVVNYNFSKINQNLLTKNSFPDKIKRPKIDICENGKMEYKINPTEGNEKEVLKYVIKIDKSQKDHLQDGIGSYIYKRQLKKINPEIFVNKNPYNIIKYNNKDYNVTQRVLIPDKNTIKLKPNKKRFFSQEKNLRYTSKGNYQSLIDRTPVILPIKGRKRLNKSFDSGNKPDNDLFLRENIKENKDIRLFGVERKYITKNHNNESEIPKYTFGRKHFFHQEVKNSLY